MSKMVKVNDSDRWSLIALGNNKTNSVELKFVDRMKRKFEFSVDSFHIMLDTLFLFYDCARMDIRFHINKFENPLNKSVEFPLNKF